MAELISTPRWCSALRPHLLATAGDCLKAAAADGILFADHLRFSRASLIHRVQFPHREQMMQRSLPVPQGSKGRPISEIWVTVSTAWQRKLQVALNHALGWAPFSEECLARLSRVLRPGQHHLADLAWENLRWQLQMGGFPQPLWRASEAGVSDRTSLVVWMKARGFDGFVCLPSEWPYYQRQFADTFSLRVLEWPLLKWVDGRPVQPDWAALSLLCCWGKETAALFYPEAPGNSTRQSEDRGR